MVVMDEKQAETDTDVRIAQSEIGVDIIDQRLELLEPHGVDSHGRPAMRAFADINLWLWYGEIRHYHAVS